MNLFDVYSLYDIEPVEGKGCRVYTSDGTEYLDLYGGHAVISIGHSHPHYIEKTTSQLQKLGFYSNAVKNSLQTRLAMKLGEMSGYRDYNLFLCNSGAEANENAIKLASFTTGRSKILAFKKSFHGRTSGAVATTDNPKIRSPFNESQKVDFVPLNDKAATSNALATREYAAVLIEGIQGVAGIHLPDDDFLRFLENECKTTGTLLILDEVQSGYGRTGKFFAHQYSGIRPDLITVGKGIANGLPAAALLIAPHIPAVKGMLGTTFGGNHLACAAALAVLEVMEKENLIDNALDVGEYLMKELRKIKGVKDVRGRGLMIGFEVEGWKGSDLRKKLLFDKQVFTGGAGEYTVRLLPALCITKQEADEFIIRLKDAIA